MIVPAAMNIESTLGSLRKEPAQEWFAKSCKEELRSAGDERFHEAGMHPPTDEFARGFVFALYVVKNMIPAVMDPKVTFG